ncbi:MAG: REP-associated tyrosine transposase [Thermoanaerobaculia bacterium]
MSIAANTYAYRRHLPHLVRADAMYAVAFCTRNRAILPPGARTLTLASCVYDHEKICWLDCAVVMPDHVHLILMPYEQTTLPKVLARIKGASSYFINRLLNRRESTWQDESFDRIVRSAESLTKKRDYLFNNPVRAGLVTHWQDYPWIWYSGRNGTTGSQPVE